MTLVMHVGTNDWRHCRFAVSPLHETTAALRMVRRVRDGELAPDLPWEIAAVRRAAELPLATLLDLLPRGSWSPDVLNPPPPGPQQAFEDELQLVADVRADRFAEELTICRSAQGLSASQADPEAQQAEILHLLELAWRELLLPSWPQLRDLLSSDVAVRARHLAAGGLAAVLADLHPQVRLVGSSIVVGIAHTDDVQLGGRGLTLLPTAWGSGVGAMWHLPWQPAVTYPARGTRAAWTPGHSSLGRLLGRTRSSLLQALSTPATTTGLAYRCNVPLSTASDHLAALRQGGLTTALRSGHAVEHRRTDLGDALVAASMKSP